MNVEERIREIRKGSLLWYSFKKGASVLFIGNETDPFFEMLKRCSVETYILSANQLDDIDGLKKREFEYIIAIESLEVLEDVYDAIRLLRNHLSKNGHMILGFNNRLGTRYFFGDRDPYTKQNYDGIENYSHSYSKKEDGFWGRCYDKETIISWITDMGIEYCCYSVLPDFSNAQIIIRDDYKSNEDFTVRVIPTYNHPKTVFLQEEYIYNTLQDNGLLHSMANCLLFDCSNDEDKEDVLQVTSSMGRDEEDAFFTIIKQYSKEEKSVIKKPAYPEGKNKIRQMIDIAGKLGEQDIDIIQMKEDEEGNIVMPFITEPTAQLYLCELADSDEKLFLKRLDAFVDVIRQSSKHISEDNHDGEGVVLARAYLDMVPLNCFVIEGRFVFFDQEFVVDNYPLNAILYRTIAIIARSIESKGISVTFNDLLKRYDLYDKREKWAGLEREFLANLRKDEELVNYYTKKRIDSSQVYSNRLRMNFSSEEYLRRFVNIFKGIDNKKVILFGTGRFAKRFMELYGQDYNISAVIDNNTLRHGEEFYGVKISGPDVLDSYEHGTYRVIICIKNFLSVTNQLEDMGITDYVVYDPSQVYERKKKPISVSVNGQNESDSDKAPKKYHTGYIAGVFDLFHVGHLEKFKLAKEQCDYLIVGLVSDEGVVKYKKTTPFIPFEDRKAMLEACRYVDEVVKIPLEFRGTRDAWKMYGFDVQFSGSDYVDDPGWLAEKEFLEQHGVDMVFFPYTESTSSSKLKKLIDEKLI